VVRGKKPAGEAGGGETELDVRGQLALPLGGEQYVLRPSFEAILAIERQLRPLFDLAEDGVRGRLTLNELTICAVEMMKAHGKTLLADDPQASAYRGATFDQVGRLIYDAALPTICGRIAIVLCGAVSGAYTPEGEAKAGTAATPAPIPAGE
jgi:hypothetical protein